MEHRSFIYPNRLTPKEKRFFFCFWFILILTTIVSFSFVFHLMQRSGDVLSGILGGCFILGLWGIGWGSRIKSGPIIITAKELRFPNIKYLWSDIQSVRLAKCDEDSESEFSILLIETKKPKNNISMRDYISNANIISPMNPDKTTDIWIDGFAQHDIHKLMTFISQRTKTYPSLKEPLRFKDI